MNVVLCGMMGAGKTTVGVALSKITGRPLVDSDKALTDKYGVISEIFAREGEASFREKETEILRALCEKDGLVLSMGGGALLSEENRRIVKANGVVVYLRATLETLQTRLDDDRERPLLHATNEPLERKLSRLLSERTPVYEGAADIVVDTDGKTPEEIAREILLRINEEKEGAGTR